MARTSEPQKRLSALTPRGKPQVAHTYFSGLSRLPLAERHEALTKGAPVKAAQSLFESFSTIDRKILLKVIGVSQPANRAVQSHRNRRRKGRCHIG